MSIDIVVSFDTTGSMYPALAEVRRKVEEFITTLFDNTPDLRIGLVAHGDYNDIYETKHVALTTNKAELVSFVRKVEQTQGFGNGGELYEKVFHEAHSFDWQAEKRVFVMIGDEPPHKKGEFVRGGSYHGHTVIYDWQEEVRVLQAMNVTVYPVRAMNRSDSINFHNTLAEMNKVPLLHLHQFSNIIPLLTAITYKQYSDDKLETYGKELESNGLLDRGLADAFNLLLRGNALVGTDNAPFKMATAVDLQAVHPSRFQMLNIDKDTPIAEFVRSTGAAFKIGRGFYELTKPEKVQERKEVVLRNAAGDMFSGYKAREMIGLPYGERGRVRPLRNLGYTVFIQSTSPNRKLIGGTRFLYEADNV